PEVDEEIKSMATIIRCEDYGPITKILGGLLMENDPETIIITFDDDINYPVNMVEKLIEHHKQFPNSAIGSSGMLLKNKCPNCGILPNEDNMIYRIPKFKVTKEGRKVDSIYGYPGALYIRKFFPIKENLNQLLDYVFINQEMFINDDIV